MDRVYPCVSPEEFLGLVQYADYIITNSFHAVAVSLIFEKQFWAIRLKKRFSRLETILRLAGIEDRILNDSEDGFDGNIDYSIVNGNLELKRKESMNFLDKVINEARDGAV